MRAISSIYPALGRYFRTMTELADAGCMSRTRAYDCLNGRKDFTPQEKKAIANAIVTRIKTNEVKVDNKSFEMQIAMEARNDFDKVFKKGKIA